jgi:S1-C subfamily serine protease
MIESHHGSWTVIPTKTILKIAAVLKKSGFIERGWIGLSCSNVDSEQTDPIGVKPNIRINRVVAGSPADAAGLKAGDFLLSLNDVPLTGQGGLRHQVSSLGIDAKLVLEVICQTGLVEKLALNTVALPEDPKRQRLCSTRTL